MYFMKKKYVMKISLKIILTLVILSALALFTTFLFTYTPPSQSYSPPLVPVAETSNSSQQKINTELDSDDLDTDQVDLPTHIKIPSIDIDAPFEYVGLTPEGAMDIPKSYANVGWFNLGPKPGENGSAVIAGHYSLIDNKPAVFDNLHKLKTDDKIYIEDEKGRNIIFVVRKIEIYDKDGDSSAIFSSNDKKAHLNLITCNGVWNNAENTFSKRLVVFTEKE